jgi:pyruvate dehydrogenase E2 component (dihydrolipoamide acetyltransferase)
MAEIVIPSVGIAMEEALVVKWLKEPGDDVAADEPVAEIETDKATMDLVSPVDGTLGPHLFEPGAVVAVGTVVAHVLVEGDELVPATPVADPPAPAAVEEPVPALGGDEARVVDGERRPHTLSPRARRLAKDSGGETGAAPDDGRFRELIAAKVTESWREIPHFAVSREVDAEPMLARLGQIRAAGSDPTPTLTDLLLRTLALALRETGRGDTSDIGLAVATPNGVVIPVVRDVLGKDAAELARARSDAVERARARRLSPDDLKGTPPVTLSNLGSFGVDHFTGIIALGQTSLLTVGRAIPRVVADGDRRLGVRTTFHATLNADHRTIDGAEAARILVAFTTAAESMTSAL